MTEIALSTGCFVNHRDRLQKAQVEALELSSHRSDDLNRILHVLGQGPSRILSVHAPCPSRGPGLNLAAHPERWSETAERVREAMQTAAALRARYIVIHAFYCLAEDLPANDIERAKALRRLSGGTTSIGEYVTSERYATAKERVKHNLMALLPDLKREYPGQRIVLENLNPRVGYGGLRFEDVADIATALDGDVGICLDVGHLTLSATALGQNPDASVSRAKDLIWTTHVHQNFAGRYFVDRNWNDSFPRPGLQEVDTHLPLLPRHRRLTHAPPPLVTADNSAFEGLLEGAVHYAAEDREETRVHGRVPVERLLSLVHRSVPRVFEFDSRYAPLEDILTEYHLARRGLHPVPLW